MIVSCGKSTAWRSGCVGCRTCLLGSGFGVDSNVGELPVGLFSSGAIVFRFRATLGKATAKLEVQGICSGRHRSRGRACLAREIAAQEARVSGSDDLVARQVRGAIPNRRENHWVKDACCV